MGFRDKIKSVFGSSKIDSKKDNTKSTIVKGNNFKSLDNLIHSGLKEVVLDSDIILGRREESKYAEGIKLDVDDLIIDGNGHTIDACGKARIFFCVGKNITIKNISFKNGYAATSLSKSGFGTNDGGAIFNKGELCIVDSIFENNTTSNGQGGAIYNQSQAKLNIKNSHFNANISDSPLCRGGGAIYNRTKGVISIEDSNFEANQACGEYGKGGAIKNTGKLSIKDSTFKNNAAKTEGGAICCPHHGEMDIEGCIFESNVSQLSSKDRDTNGGGAISSISMSIFHCIFKFNRANGEYGKGGAIIIQISNSPVEIKNSIFEDNNANEGGGAIYNYKVNNLNIENSSFVRNISENGTGGAIYSIGDKSKCRSLCIQSSNFESNNSNSGGALYNGGGFDVHITDSIFKTNLSEEGGSAIFNKNHNVLSIHDSTFEANGDVILNNGDLIINDSSFEDNLSEYGAILTTFKKCKIFNSKFLNNSAGKNIIFNSDFLEINDSIFNHNRSSNIFYNENKSNLTIFNGKFVENDIKESIIHNHGKICTVSDTIFENNVINNDSKNIINRTDLTLINPKIKDEGKTILNDGNILIRKSSENLESKIVGEGSVKYAGKEHTKSNLGFEYLDKIIHESTTNEIILEEDICFGDDEIDFYEGGIELDVDNLIIDGNGKTIDGLNNSRIFFITGNNITLKNITFKNGYSHKYYDNLLNNHGGALRINHVKNLSIENCKFINNNSESNGGAIWSERAILNIKDSIFEGNTAENCGGAIYREKSSNFTILESSFKENSAGQNAGAIFTGENGVLSIISSNFEDNLAKNDGGAIYNKKGSAVKVEGSNFVENIADNDGGAIYNRRGSSMSVEGSNFVENSAKRKGDDVYDGTNSKKLNLIKCNFKNNKLDGVFRVEVKRRINTPLGKFEQSDDFYDRIDDYEFDEEDETNHVGRVTIKK